MDFTAPASVTDGVVEFPCVPGPAVLMVSHAGVPQITVPLVVPDKPAASLEECMQAAGLADNATQSVLEDLARRVVEGVAAAEQAAQTATEQAETATEQAQVATTKAGEAGASAKAAKTSETNAKTSETNAAGSASAAKTSETNAKTSETNAGKSASAAATSATEAANSAGAAKTSETNAANSASAAKTSENNAAGSAGAAKTDADRAKTEADRAAETVASGVPDATTTTKGKIALAGDLAGMADAPTVPKLASKADLVGGLVPTSQLPAVALTKPFVVADRAGMLALSAQEGDVAVITSGADKGTYMLGTGVPTAFASWVALVAPTDAVTSVNGQTGVVNLTAGNVGAAPTTHTHTTAQVTGLDTALDGKTDKTYVDARSPQIQVVTALPASPAAGVVYLVTG
ncbi:hypothetical protein [Corynebacterium sanguinis]|uniref:hypothetical protein n=1 Tax=Corynebacterium sanguinis TaxID=2594913 RepID=UPI0021A7539A|nr:hypothetical protein [Corynebacterium sanguinis]MCT1411644.1 hypothetical protein [Corynebacterium sanguinis]